MTKAELVAQVAREVNVTKTQAEKAVSAVTETITDELRRAGKISLTGFGTFSVASRRARTGRNPRSGQEIRIPPSKTPKFTAGKA